MKPTAASGRIKEPTRVAVGSYYAQLGSAMNSIELAGRPEEFGVFVKRVTDWVSKSATGEGDAPYGPIMLLFFGADGWKESAKEIFEDYRKIDQHIKSADLSKHYTADQKQKLETLRNETKAKLSVVLAVRKDFIFDSSLNLQIDKRFSNDPKDIFVTRGRR